MNEIQNVDIAIVGYGPVGQSLAILLGERGYKVAVFDRWPTLYPLPRAVFHDHEIRRVFHAMGIGEDVAKISQPSATYQWFNADWKTLVEIDWSAESISDGPVGYLFNQPSLEALLDAKARTLPSVQVFQGWEATDLRQTDDYAELTLKQGAITNGHFAHTGQSQTVRAKYVVGADGANSFVRTASGIELDDLGFQEDWLVIDVKPNDGVKLDVPDIGQWCNPARPTTMVPGGPGYRRWEFMRLPNEALEDLQKVEKVWELLAPWVNPDNATLVRHAVYRFRSLLARDWHKGRVLLAGDAAHLMPPFMGQGMCSGVRDAWNLAWRFDMILRGVAQPELLNSYTDERRPQVRAVIDASIAMGRVVCIADPQEAARRDAAYLSGQVPELPPFPGISDGVIDRGVPQTASGVAGQLSVHGKVIDHGTERRYDEAVPNGFHVIVLDDDAGTHLSARAHAVLEAIGGRCVTLISDANGHGAGQATDSAHRSDTICSDTIHGNTLAGQKLIDGSGKYTRFFREHGARAVVVRPDYYLYGAVSDLSDLSVLVEELGRKLCLDTNGVARDEAYSTDRDVIVQGPATTLETESVV